jgi:hypothetical protein
VDWPRNRARPRFFRRRRRAVCRGFRLVHTPMRFALRESTRQISLKCPAGITGLGCDAIPIWLSTSNAGPVADMFRNRQSIAPPLNAIVALFRTRWRWVAVVHSWRLQLGGSIDWFRGPSRSRLLSQSRLRLRNCSNDAGEFYEVINIGDAGHVISRTQAVVECLAKSMIEALTSLDLWQIFPQRALHAGIGLFLTNNNVSPFRCKNYNRQP